MSEATNIIKRAWKEIEKKSIGLSGRKLIALCNLRPYWDALGALLVELEEKVAPGAKEWVIQAPNGDFVWADVNHGGKLMPTCHTPRQAARYTEAEARRIAKGMFASKYLKRMVFQVS